ncbi:hypothetical protein SBOR_1533 [Sclerotinia borealis F-4128]|uniref:Uncharacterized protein n=1 Tax=Sclerotinia borealis (strain F-4128) TaxID=1432307 RepID=W9CMP8_SCLBF|nr:hypothetical protein SBOR_1533 [Sclerotinia borealis F-4128]
MSLLRNRANIQPRDDVNSDNERTPGEGDKKVLYQTPGIALRSQQLVGQKIPSPRLTQDRRNLARDALAAVRGAGDKLRVIGLLSGLASTPVTDEIPASAASQQVGRPDGLPPVAGLAAANVPTASNQEPVRRTKRFGKAQSRSTNLANDIKNFMPIQLEFTPHLESDRSNEWFQNAYAVLFERIVALAREHFGFQELQSEFHEPWAVEMPDEFLRYCELVAEPDPAVGGWDELLINTESRRFLIVGIIVKILEVKVFAPSLWGNNEEGEELLHGLDRALLDGEGYARQALRSRSIRTLLGGASVTPNFHSDCTTLTAQMILLLGPLFNYLTILPARPNTITPAPAAFYQGLHNIVSSAAYLSICVRISPTIIHIAHLVPGTPYSTDEDTSILQSSWTLSKTIVQHDWNTRHALMEVERANAEGYKLGYETIGRQNSRAGRQATRNFEAIEQQFAAHKPPGYTHRASVKIAVWPVIRRYWAGNGKPGGEMDGQSVYVVTNAGAVFYYKETDKEVTSLFDFVAQKKRVYNVKFRRARDLLSVLALLSLGVFLSLVFTIGWTELVEWVGRIVTRAIECLQDWMSRITGTAHRAYEYSGAHGAEWAYDKASSKAEYVYCKASSRVQGAYDKAASKYSSYEDRFGYGRGE